MVADMVQRYLAMHSLDQEQQEVVLKALSNKIKMEKSRKSQPTATNSSIASDATPQSIIRTEIVDETSSGLQSSTNRKPIVVSSIDYVSIWHN
jgi:hypothetical protein